MVYFRGKCLLIGDSTVGKSTICQMFHSDGAQFQKNYQMTIGVELLVKAVNVPDTQDTVELFMYDCSGKDVFSDIVAAHFQDVSMIIAVYDVTSESSFANCSSWIKNVKEKNQNMSMPGVLVANRVDLTNRRMVSEEQGQELAEKEGLVYFEGSAKNYQDIEAPFMHLVTSFRTLCTENGDSIYQIT